ncbi:MAG: hypothetical protein K2P57_12965 [Burkholderiales bacterium]|nr:hypothetical protein [Burkholderiales bacterium]
MNIETHRQLAGFILTECRQALITSTVTGKIDVCHHVNQAGKHHATIALS